MFSPKPWLTIVGIGDDGFDSLSEIAHHTITTATLIIGGDRHLKFLPKSITCKRLLWSSPIQGSINELLTYRGQSVCILASGDPLCHGIATTLLRSIPLVEMQIIPALSAFTLARSRLGWSSTEVETISLCGRDPAFLRAALYPNAKLLVLSSDQDTPNIVCDRLTEWGYGDADVTILEHLGGRTEKQLHTIARQRFTEPIAALNTIAIQIHNSPFSIPHSQFSIPDTEYQHDGQLTKQEIRTLTLAALSAFPGQLLWDVGAGSGSIGIEWMRTHPRNQAIAIESHPDRLANITHNAKNLGVPNLKIIAGRAPEALQNLQRPDSIFIGGGVTRSGVFETCWDALNDGGRMVINGVTLETEMKLFQLKQVHGGSLTRIQIQRAEPIGNFLGWKPLSPITQWLVTKPTTP
ncbi:MAG: precorrin-6y C5,15-methyltransferase (decarboxylating) subunit CbiE [Alkalinema sp. CAN_BIN05]|nr:precorrin-6y C5,15-methyltransferase (decarboxylating) subunit CbiE [Alkalinema sp. CAN_BIN05]